MTRALILAAGRGERMGLLARGRPKCLLELNGQTLLAHQVRNLETAGIRDITVVTGHAAGCIEALGLPTVHNADWDCTNMVASMFSAAGHFEAAQAPVLVHYGDVLVEPGHLARMVADARDVVCLLDEDWLPYFKSRGSHWRADVEGLRLAASGAVASFGRSGARVSEAEARFIGVMRCSAAGARNLFQAFHAFLRCDGAGAGEEGGARRLDCTSFLQRCIDHGVPVNAHLVKGGWLELDCASDYLQARSWVEAGRFPFLDGQATLGLDEHRGRRRE